MKTTTYFQNKIADYLFGQTAYTLPAPYYAGLLLDADEDALPDGTVTEVSGGSYARASLANDKTTFSVSVGGAVDNDIEIVFPSATADWGAVTYFGLFDAATSGNLLMWGEANVLTGDPVTINNGKLATFQTGELTLTVT